MGDNNFTFTGVGQNDVADENAINQTRLLLVNAQRTLSFPSQDPLHLSSSNQQSYNAYPNIFIGPEIPDPVPGDFFHAAPTQRSIPSLPLLPTAPFQTYLSGTTPSIEQDTPQPNALHNSQTPAYAVPSTETSSTTRSRSRGTRKTKKKLVRDLTDEDKRIIDEANGFMPFNFAYSMELDTQDDDSIPKFTPTLAAARSTRSSRNPLEQATEPIDYFELFFDKRLNHQILYQTDEYYRQWRESKYEAHENGSNSEWETGSDDEMLMVDVERNETNGYCEGAIDLEDEMEGDADGDDDDDEDERGEEEDDEEYSPVRLKLSKLRTFYGIIIAMGILKYPSIRDYWKKEHPVLGKTNFGNFIKRDEFLHILRFIHLRNNHDSVPGNLDKLFKVRPFLDHLRDKCKQLFVPGEFVSVDEIMIAFTGRSSIKQYMPLKPVKRGYKVWGAADSATGYLWNFEVYEGGVVASHGDDEGQEVEELSNNEEVFEERDLQWMPPELRAYVNPPPNILVKKQVSAQVVLRLSEGLSDGTTIVADNHFSTTSLAITLNKRNMHFLGTARPTR